MHPHAAGIDIGGSVLQGDGVFVAPGDATVTIDRFGASAAGSRNMEEFGFTGKNVAARARELLLSANTDKEA